MSDFSTILQMMLVFLKLTIGILLLAFGLIYLFNPEMVLKINGFLRNIVLDDRIILLKRKKLSVLFFCLSFIVLYMGLSSFSAHIVQTEDSWKKTSVHFLMYQALQNFADQRFDRALQKYRTVVSIDPANTEAMKRISTIYEMQGKSEESKELLKKALRITPQDREILSRLKKNEKNK